LFIFLSCHSFFPVSLCRFQAGCNRRLFRNYDHPPSFFSHHKGRYHEPLEVVDFLRFFRNSLSVLFIVIALSRFNHWSRFFLSPGRGTLVLGARRVQSTMIQSRNSSPQISTMFTAQNLQSHFNCANPGFQPSFWWIRAQLCRQVATDIAFSLFLPHD